MMNNINTKNKEIPEKALKLLPWFAVGGLSVEDQAYFEEALIKHPALQQRLDQEHEIIGLISKDKALLELSGLEPIEERLKKVFIQIDSTAAGKSVNSNEPFGVTNKFKQALASFLSNNFNILEYNRYASAAIFVISLAVLMAFIAPLFIQENDFTPASSKISEANNSSATTILLVGFNGSPDALGSNPALKGKLTKVESVPGKKGMYRASLNKKLSADQIKELIAALAVQKELVWFVGEAF